MVGQWPYGLHKRLGLPLLSYQFFKKTLLVDAVVLPQKKKVGNVLRAGHNSQQNVVLRVHSRSLVVS
jgi:hypothetical protein